MLDVVIVGGSVAGLSAALYLGRSLRQTVVFDTGEPCNRFSHAAHGFLTRDGTPPSELLQIGRTQLERYATVALQTGKVTAIHPQENHFLVELQEGKPVATRKVLLATGMNDALPAIENIDRFWGRSVFHCPFCDGWEVRDQPVATLGNGELALHKAKLLRHLTADLVICTGEAATFSETDRQLLLTRNIRIIETPIARIEGQGDQLTTLVFADGTTLARHALFIQPTPSQHAPLAMQLGCMMNDLHGISLVQVDAQARTNVAGVYAAGDITTLARQVISAAAQGATAAVTIHSDLLVEEYPLFA